ncbi:EAL domain-containing protein [Sulfurimonas sp. C5]|uniref:sensor domain-containing diguanylate cyclase n=1 Tax=Sulfurimonas sp. C5 TaxID=3036947 RepID=UPI0024568BF0|nr:EAL domain-containing protein [Sulfurimonas sp. C5]MDH4944141.1 EAL domain-containing protein [Sulfurimonas sp. C5]
MSFNDTSCNLELQDLEEVQITPEEYNNIITIQNDILSMIAAGTEARSVLDTLCLFAEKLLPNSVASVMLVDSSNGLMSVLSAPSVPDVGHQALANLKPGAGGGSCGNAVFRNEAQYVTNTFEDDRWRDLRKIAYDFNLCACWSMPIRDQYGIPVGSFALSSFEHRSPSNFHKKLLETGSKIISIVLKNIQKDQKIKLFSVALQNASEGIIITDQHNKIIECNQAFKDIYKFTDEEIFGKNPRILSSRLQSPSFYREMWETLEKTSKWAGEITNIDAHGNEVIQWLSISILEFQGKKNYVGIFTNLTELKAAQMKIEALAYTDTLTSLNNKAKLARTLETYHGDITLILLNVNNFSYINSAYGFEIGDEILVDIAEVLKNNFGTHETFRINADEFALLYTKEVDIKELVAEIQEYFYSSTLLASDLTFNISFTYGAVFTDANHLRDAAFALKKAKENGKNNLYIYEPSTSREYSEENKKAFIESSRHLYSALLEHRVIPYFQGIRDNKTGKILKFEVLARIQEFDKVLSPIAFLEAARLSGLLTEITKRIIDTSFKEMSKNDYSFSINITEDDLNQHFLKDYLLQKTKEYNISPNRVILEVLEGVSATGKTNHVQQLKSLKASGFRIAIDDFGSEYSNFERILDMEIDFLKIDARYIKNIDTDKKSYEITKAISFFAKNAKIPTIAEFVHSQAVQNKLDELGIEYSQGFLFSEPTPKPIER